VHRRPSPLLHDYKQAERLPTKRPRPLRWFAVGLGIPLIVSSAFFLVAEDTREMAASDAVGAPTHTVEAIAADDGLALLEEVVFTETAPALPFLESHPDFHPPLGFPEPVYDSLNITIRRGDTLKHRSEQAAKLLGATIYILGIAVAAYVIFSFYLNLYGSLGRGR